MTDRIDIIAIFAAVADQASFAGAARRLGRTPAAVTRAIAALEERLRTRLLNRTTRSVSLTDDGARYLAVCRQILAAYEELQRLEIGSEAPPHGLLHVTAPTVFGRLHVLPVIQSYLARYPLVDVRATLVDRVVSLVDEGMDVGIRLGALPDSSLRAIAVGQAHMAVYGSPEYLETNGMPATPQDLSAHALVSCGPMMSVPNFWPFEGGNGVDGIAIRPRLLINTADAAADAAAAGLGLAYLVSYQVEEHVRAGRLRRVLDAYTGPPFPIQIVHPAGRFVSTKVRLFVEHAATELKARLPSA